MLGYVSAVSYRPLLRCSSSATCTRPKKSNENLVLQRSAATNLCAPSKHRVEPVGFRVKRSPLHGRLTLCRVGFSSPDVQTEHSTRKGKQKQQQRRVVPPSHKAKRVDSTCHDITHHFVPALSSRSVVCRVLVPGDTSIVFVVGCADKKPMRRKKRGQARGAGWSPSPEKSLCGAPCFFFFFVEPNPPR